MKYVTDLEKINLHEDNLLRFRREYAESPYSEYHQIDINRPITVHKNKFPNLRVITVRVAEKGSKTETGVVTRINFKQDSSDDIYVTFVKGE